MPALSIKGKLVSGGTDASELTQKINNINDSISNILGDFATIEPAATASKPYEIGERLVLNGLYYKVTAAISQGNALVVDGNIEKTTVGDDITSLNKDFTELKANELGVSINIVKDALLTDNFYTCNSDGYIWLECGNDVSNYCTVLIYGATLDRITVARVVGGSQIPIQSIYVRKGMRIKVNSAYGTWLVRFTPFE